MVALHYQDLLNPDGTPKRAKDLLARLQKTGLPRFAEIVTIADDPAEAAVVYCLLKLMGYPELRLRVALSGRRCARGGLARLCARKAQSRWR